MSRRGSPAVQVLVVIIVVLIFLYGFYSYHQQHTRLKISEELGDKFKQKAESLSAQLQGVFFEFMLFFVGTHFQAAQRVTRLC
jgi:hypothetical protein